MFIRLLEDSCFIVGLAIALCVGGIMPYCWKCGAELDEDARFCSVCGASVLGVKEEEGVGRGEEEGRRRMGVFGVVAVVLVVVVVAAVVFAAFAFLPVRAVDVRESRVVPYQAGVDVVYLDFVADVARVDVAFEDLSGELVALNVSATGGVGVFGSPDRVFDLSFDDSVVGGVLTLEVEVDTFGGGWPWHPWLQVSCDLRLDSSLNASLDVRTGTGRVVLDSRAGVVFNSLSLEATTGRVKAVLVEGVVVAGDVSVKTTTGGVEFSWNNVVVTRNVLVNAKTTTGGVDLYVKQHEELARNVTLKAEATTGGVDFAIDIKGDVGAEIESATSIGGIDVDRQVGFSGTKSMLRSNNYSADGNFDVSLKTTTGGIDIDAKHTP